MTFAQVRAALFALALVGYFGIYGTRDVPRQFRLAGELRERLDGLDDTARRSAMFYRRPEVRQLYAGYSRLIEEVTRDTPPDARIGLIWTAPRYLLRFAPYYLYPRHTFEVDAARAPAAVAELRLDTLVRTAFTGNRLTWTIEHVE